MASAITHAVAAGSIACWFHRPGIRRGVWVAGVVCAIVPDLDVIGYRLGVPYGSLFGHRGITHSIAFAALLAALVARALQAPHPTGMPTRSLWLFLFLATALHGVLDAFTNGGGGIAFFAPFWNKRFFFPFTPILVSPLSIGRFISARGLRILASEAVWVWLPAALVAAAGLLARRQALRGEAHAG